MSLEGLSSLIQLESTRLEGARQTSQNFQQANSAVQQVGSQTAQAKTGIWRDKIEATYSKEVQEATVRKLESRLARERKAESMAKNIAMTVTTISALSNAWDSVSDLLGKQKLGDIPEYLKTPKIDPATANVVTTPAGDGSTNNVVWAMSQPDPKTGVVSAQCMTQENNGAMKDAKSAVIGDYDMKSVVGNDSRYKSGMSFAELVKTAPDLAMKVMQDKQHAMGRSESSEFVDVLKKNMPDSSNISRMDHNAPKAATTEPTQTTDPQKLASIQSELEKAIKEGKPTEQLGKIQELVSIDGKPKQISSLTTEDLSKLKTGDLAKNLKDAQSLAQVSQLATQGAGTKDTAPTAVGERPKNYSMIAIPQADGGLSVTMLDKDKKTSTTVKLSKDDTDIAAFKGMGKSKGSDDDALADKFMSKVATQKPTPVSGEVESNKDFQMKVNSGTAFKAAVDTLKGSGVLDKNYDSKLGKAFSVIGDVGSAGMNFIVNTAKDSAPYFQAYLAQKSRADSVEEELIEARQKLAAENKKLKNIQMQIDLFNGRGS